METIMFLTGLNSNKLKKLPFYLNCGSKSHQHETSSVSLEMFQCAIF